MQQEEKEAEREESRECYEEQCGDRRLQFQMHQDNMQHQQQFMTTMLLMHGIRHSWAPIPNILPMTLSGYTFPVNNQQEEEEKHREEGNKEETEGGTEED